MVPRLVGLALGLAFLSCGMPAPDAVGAGPVLRPSQLSFLARTEIPPGQDEIPVGGLSGLFYDPEEGRFHILSDDKGDFGPPRIYRVRLDLDLEPEPSLEATVEDWIPLRGWEGRGLSMDPEGLASAPGGGYYVASEGWVRKGLNPFLARFDPRGVWKDEIPLPSHVRIGVHGGPRQNRALESLTLTPGGRFLFTATENALRQDGPAADPGSGSLSRILRWDVEGGRWDRELVYRTEPVHAAPTVSGGLATAGLVELLALDGDSLLALERSYATGRGFAIRLFAVETRGATDVARFGSLQRVKGLRPVTKHPLLDLRDLGFPLDNVEGMAFGPRLRDGRRSLYLVSDDNFNAGEQVTQVLVFGIGPGS